MYSLLNKLITKLKVTCPFLLKKNLFLFILLLLCPQFAFTAVFSINNRSYAENDRNYDFTLTATATPSSPCTRYQTYSVDYATADGTATAGSDYTATNGTSTQSYTGLTRTSGTCWTKTITVRAIEDTIYEPDETFYVNLSNASSNATISDSQGIGTITNDDSEPTLSLNSDVTHNEGNNSTTSFTFTIIQDKISAYNTSFYFSTADGTATLTDNDYVAISNQLVTIPEGSTTATVTVLVNGDVKYEGLENFKAIISNSTNATINTSSRYGYITNDDATNPVLSINSDITRSEEDSGTTPYVFTITQDKAVAYDTSFYFSTANGTATVADNDYIAISNQLVIIPAGSLSTTVTVLVNGDTKYEVQESFSVTISNPTNATLGSTSTRYGYIANNDILPTITISDANLTEGNTSYSNMEFTVTISKAADASVNYATSDGTAIAGSDYDAVGGVLVFRATDTNLSKTILVPIESDSLVENNETFTVTLSNEINATLAKATAIGTIINDDKSYCENNNLSTGFHIINPFNDINKSIEIFCSDNRDFIALPNKNSSNNFVFNNNALSSVDYYDRAKNDAKHFDAIEINAYTLQVQAASSLRDPQTVNDFKAMGSSFSNINLTGTPFAIDWDNTTISNCTSSKLRKAYYGQDVKINTLDYDDKAICNVESMKLKLLDDYRYLVYRGTEVLEKSCKAMAEAVPTSFLNADTVKGHYWISPSLKTRSYNSTSIKSDDRPIISYCWYQNDLKLVWTFLLAMDGKVTNKKSDLVTKTDTCSEFGLLPFVPNNEETFNRVRVFLSDKKSQWVKYTGTNNEKFRVFNNNANYYLDTEYDSEIWPYGSFGVYNPKNGADWTSKGAAMSGSPIHNIKSITTDYSRFNDGTNRDYYSWGHYSSTDAIADTNRYAYSDTMGAKGWVSILGSADLNKTNEWFISRTGAGDNFNSKGAWPYYEPNGNYTGGAWLNFLFDSTGRVRHLDDLDAAYSYYDYMCMAEDNYDFYQEFDTTKGALTVIEHGQSIYNGLSKSAVDEALKTKVVKSSLDFDLLFWNNDQTAVSKDQNLSAGLFLTEEVRQGSGYIINDLHYFGQVNGANADFNVSASGSLYISPSKWPNGSNVIKAAKKKVFFQFKYCDDTRITWTGCWTKNGNTATCTPGCVPNTGECLCKTAESDTFAVRPKKFDTDFSPTTTYKAGKDYNITFFAKDYTNADTTDYNETIPLTPTETKAGCITGVYDTNLSNLALENGKKLVQDLSYSEVGVVNIKIKELSGSEFAKVDANDTTDAQRYIETYDKNITYTPDHFNVTGALTNGANGFTYISSDLNMSLTLDLNITAQREDNATTQNYSYDCYAKRTDYNISYNNLVITPTNTLSTIKYIETNTSTEGNVSINNNITLNNIYKSIFSTDHNGSGLITMEINFDRNITQPSNPLSFVLRDINVSDDDAIVGTKDLNQSSLFYHGRAHAPDYRFSNRDGNATIYYEVYCKDCNRTAFNMNTWKESVNAINWYQNPLHVSTAGLVAPTPQIPANFSNTGVTNTDPISTQRLTLKNTTAIPYVDRIDLNSSSWLIAFPTNFTVEFYNSGTWAGAGFVKQEHANAVDNNTTVGGFVHQTAPAKANRRMSW